MSELTKRRVRLVGWTLKNLLTLLSFDYLRALTLGGEYNGFRPGSYAKLAIRLAVVDWVKLILVPKYPMHEE